MTHSSEASGRQSPYSSFTYTWHVVQAKDASQAPMG